MNVRRRDLLRAGAAIAASAALPDWARVASAAAPPKNLIVVLNSGGWDPTYVLDPKPGLTAIDAPAGKVQSFGAAGGLSVLTDPSRPKVTDFFTRYGSMAAVINGVQVQSFIHIDCTKRIMTGTPSDTNPDVGAIAAYESARDLPVPYLVLGSSALSGPLASYTGRAGTTNQISALLTPDAAYPEPGATVPSPSLQPTAAEDQLVAKYIKASADRVKATRGQRGSNAAQIDAFVKSLDRSGLLRDFAKTRGGFGKQAYVPDLAVQVQVGATALEGGLCHSVMMETSNWDTHSNNAMQGTLNDTMFGGLTALAQELEKRSLLGKTVVVVLSEMGRTPKLNAAGGKDHWPVTSALVFGAGVAGGRVFGGTDGELGAQSVNLATGSVDTNGVQLQTGNLVAGVLSLCGVDPATHFPGVEPFRALSS